MNKGEAHNLQNFFNPKSVAIIGASSNEQKIGTIILRNIEKSGYTGEIFIINPHLPPLGKHRGFSTYTEIPLVPDLAIIAIPAEGVVEVLSSIGTKGTKNIVILSAGFKESGKAGIERETELLEIAKQFDLKILGPNCLGFLNTADKLNATFGQVALGIGNVRFASQSGALATGLFDWAAMTGVAFSQFVTLGNKSVLNENDFLDYWLQKPKMSFFRAKQQEKLGLSPYEPVGLYLESIVDGKAFLTKAQAVSRYNPVVLLKPGKSMAAQRAMHSHTGALAGDSAVLEAALKDTGIIRADGVEDMFDLLRAIAWERAPEGNRVAVISNAGGPAVVATDTLEQYGMVLAQFSKRTANKLIRSLPPAANIHDPVDILGDALADRYAVALELALSESTVDAVLVILTPQVMTQIEATAKVIVEMSKKYHKTIFCSFMGGTMVALGEQILNEAKIPSFRFPERAIRTLARMADWRAWQRKKIILTKKQPALIKQPSIDRVVSFIKTVKMERDILTNFEVNEVFREAGISVPQYALAPSIDEAFEFCNKYEFPVILKISSAKLLHKTDVGAVIPNITNEQDLLPAYLKISKVLLKLQKEDPDAEIIIAQFIPGGQEVIVGVKRDQNFGNVLLLGAGGVFAELMGDTTIRCLPQNKEQVREMLQASKIGKILMGYRGGKVYAVDELINLILRLAHLVENVNLFSEIEINPVIVTETEVYAADGKAILL
jgi:acetyltransferase